MIKYTLQTSDDGKVHTLLSNGSACTCPFKTSVPVPNKLGQPVFIGQSCNSSCPHFAIASLEATKYAVLSCGDSKDIKLEPTEPKTETKTNSGIIL